MSRHAPARVRRSVLAVATVLALGVGLAPTGVAAPGVAAEEPAEAPRDLRVESLPAPMAVEDLASPELGWQLAADAQSAYEVRVGTGPDVVADADVWDSGRVASDRAVDVPYGGEPLAPSERYWWTVRTWDGDGVPSDWAEPAVFGTGPGSDWGDAETIWAGDPDAWGGDFTLSFRAQFTQRHVTVLFRAKDGGNYYLWQLRGDGANELATHVRVNNDPSPPVLKTVPLGVEIENGPDARFYDVRLEVTGDTIRTYLDDRLVDTTTDATFTAGGFGFRTGSTEAFAVDDVVMTSLDGDVIYANDFADATHNDFGCGTVADGRYTIGTRNSAGCVYQGPWSDYDLELDVTVAERATGVVFRAQDAANYLMWQIRADTSTVVPHTRVNGQFTALPASAVITPRLAVGERVRVRIEARGPRIRTFVDDVLVDDREVGAAFRAGGIGFRNGSTEQGIFDNVVVSTPRGEVVYRNDFPAGNAEFACGTVVDGALRVGRSGDCVMASLPSGGHDWAFLRGEVELADKEIAWATVHASASSTLPGHQYVYRLWLDGELVGLGPTQPMAGENRYDGYDVTNLVRRAGTHALGALAHTTEDHEFIARLVVGYADGTRQTFVTGRDWRALPGTAVYPPGGSTGTSYYTTPVENLQATKYPFGFAEPGFDDSAWSAPVVKAPMDRLTATTTANVAERLEAPARVVEKAPGHYFVDFGRTWAGGVRLDLEGTAGQRVEIRYGEELTDAATTANTVRWQMRTGNTYRDTYTLAAGEQTLQNWGLRVFRYVEILGAPQPITAENLAATALVYPFDTDAARFGADEDAIEAVWQLSKNTIEALNVNLYVDTWTRERINYEADAFIQLQSHIYLDSDPTLAWYSMEYLLTRRTWPTEWPMYVVLGMHELWQSTGQTETLERVYDQLKTKLPEQYLEESTGLIRKVDGSDGSGSRTDHDIVDWPAGERDGYQFRQYNTVINALAYKAYLDMADIADVTGHPADAERYRAVAGRMREAINTHLYDPVKGAYRDGMDENHVPTEHWALHASVWPQAFGVTPEAERVRVGEYLATRGMRCSVYCAPFLLQALYDGDQGDAAYGLLTSTGIRSWLNMIAQGAGATMEAWDTSLKSNTSFSHPWASSPAFMIPRGMFGIQSVEPGYEVFSVRPQPGGLTTADVTVPTVRGEIAAAFEVVGDDVDLALRVPRGTTAQVSVPRGTAAADVVHVDGVAQPAEPSGSYLLVDVGPGCHAISVDGERRPGPDSPLAVACPEGFDVVDEPSVTLEVATRCVVGRVVEVVRVTNVSGASVEAAVSTGHGERTVALAADRSASVTMSTRLPAVPAGSASATVDGDLSPVTATYPARRCG
jgi:hypothetical protein